MKIGIISDIHSNLPAFKACVDFLEAKECDTYFLLGDYVSDTPYTRETMDYLYEFIESHECYVLRGNREEYMLGQRQAIRESREDEIWLANSSSGNLLFAYKQLTEKDLDFFESLPITFRFEKEGLPAITCCHGSPDNTRELLQLYRERTKEWLGKIETDYMICAHTHFPGALFSKGKRYYNTGCVGISIGDAGYAQCMILEDKRGFFDGTEKETVRWVPTFLHIPYDNNRVVQDMMTSGLAQMGRWFVNANIQTVSTGIDRASTMVDLAKKLSAEAGEKEVWPRLKECYFERAARELDIPDYIGL